MEDMSTRNARRTQAQVLWDKGWGNALHFKTFEGYLKTIPPVPKWPAGWEERFDRLLLVDARVPLAKAAKLAKFWGPDDKEKPDDTHHYTEALPEVYWLRCQDGRRHRGQSAQDASEGFLRDERGLMAIEGIALYLQDPSVVTRHSMFLSCTTTGGFQQFVASLGGKEGLDIKDWEFSGAAMGCASCGVAAELKKKHHRDRY